MNISSRCEYACRAMVELARHAQSQEPISSVAIAERWSIPEKYLVHILLQLKRAGLVRSVRGAHGGYVLARSPDELTLFDIVTAIDGAILDPLPVDDATSRELRPAWQAVAQGIAEALRGATLRQLMDRTIKTDMYYI